MPKFVRRIPFVITLALLLFSCGGGFEAIDNSNDSDLIYKINTSITAYVESFDYPPLPMPGLDENDPRLKDVLPRNSDPERQTVAPFSAEKVTPLVDGQVLPANLSNSPYKAGGRISMRFPSGGGGTCTAQFVGNSGVLLTAAHCVHSKKEGGFIENMNFKLRYNSGASAGTFDWQCVAIVAGWTKDKMPYDYAFVKVRGVPQSGVGLKINVAGTHVDSMGYPYNYGNTEVMHHISNVKDGSNPSRMSNPMREGASGGGWIADDGNAVSLNSFYVKPDTQFLYGPTLTSTSMDVYDFVAGGCASSSAALGARTSIGQSAEDSATETVLTVANRALIAGAAVTYENSPECSCDAASKATLLNESERLQLVGVQRISTSNLMTDSTTEYMTIKAGQRIALGCTRASSTGTATCQQDNVFRVSSSRAIPSENVAMPQTTAGVTMASALAVRDLNQCIEVCGKGDANTCFNLGDQAIAALAPLGKFVDTVDSASSSPDGSIVAKDDIITEYGGDPAKVEDVCYRSGVEKDGFAIKNHGLQCAVLTKTVFPTSTFKTRLSMPAAIEGRPSSWSSAFAKIGTIGKQTLFPDLANAPAIDFTGGGATPLNSQFAGDVYGVTASTNRTLILATTRGCLTGAYKK